MKGQNKIQAHAFLSLTKRHLLVFLKNIPTVIFTLMVPLAVFAVYVLFLREMEISQLTAALNAADIFFDISTEAGRVFAHRIYGIADTWMIAGVLSVSCFTVSLNANYIMVRDKEGGVAKDFISSPISPMLITSSYLVFNTIITFITNMIVYFICLIFLACYGAYMITFVDFLSLIGLIFLSSFSSALITFFVCSFIKTESVLSPVVAICSAAIGFLIGAYLPANVGPAYLDNITGFFPGTYFTGLFRSYFMREPIELLRASAEMQTEAGKNFMAQMETQFSLNNKFFGTEILPWMMLLISLGFIIFFSVLNYFFATKNYMNFLKTKVKKSKNSTK